MIDYTTFMSSFAADAENENYNNALHNLLLYARIMQRYGLNSRVWHWQSQHHGVRYRECMPNA